MELNEKQRALCAESRWDFSGLSALFLNCTLKRSPELSHTEGLIDLSRQIMEANGVAVEVLRPVDRQLAFGVWPDMTEHGWERDDWPEILPQADAGWIGEAGPGPSYLDPGSGGPENEFTNRNTTFMTWNLLHLARLLREAGGVPAHGNQRSEWDAGCRFDSPNPEHR